MRFLKPWHGSFGLIAVLFVLWSQYQLSEGNTVRAFLATLNGIVIALVAVCWAVADRGRRP